MAATIIRASWERCRCSNLIVSSWGPSRVYEACSLMLASNGSATVVGELERMFQNVAFYTVWICHRGVCLEDVRRIAKYWDQVGGSKDRDQNQSSPESETVILIIRRRRLSLLLIMRTVIAQSVNWLATGWTSGVRLPLFVGVSVLHCNEAASGAHHPRLSLYLRLVLGLRKRLFPMRLYSVVLVLYFKRLV
jgi:hypothetical protein